MMLEIAFCFIFLLFLWTLTDNSNKNERIRELKQENKRLTEANSSLQRQIFAKYIERDLPVMGTSYGTFNPNYITSSYSGVTQYSDGE